MAQGDAAFPRNIELLGWDTLLWSLIVLILSTNGSIYTDHTRIALAGIYQNGIKTNFITGNPSAIEPQNIDVAIISGQLVELVLGKLAVVLPPVWMLLLLVVDAAVRGCIIRVPEPFAVPVWFGEITANHESLVSVGIEYLFGDVVAWILAERSMGDGEVGIFGIKHAEAIVVLGGEDHILHTCLFHHVCPFARVEVHWIEGIFLTPVPCLVLLVGWFAFTYNPVFRTD